MKRREFFGSTAGLISATAFGQVIFHQQGAHASTSNLDPISFDDFKTKLHDLADIFLTNPATEASYLYEVASLLSRINVFPDLQFGLPFDLGNGVEFFKGTRTNKVSINKLTMAPNGYLKAHDHRYYVGILICLEGSFKCRNFDILNDTGSKVTLQKTSEIAIGEGDIAIVLQGKNNVHDFRADNKDVKIYDLFTFIDEASAESKFLEIDEASWNSGNETYDAKWL